MGGGGVAQAPRHAAARAGRICLAVRGITRSGYHRERPAKGVAYIEEYVLSAGLRAGDAIIAATAVEDTLPLMSANAKHFRPIKELDLVVFRP